MKKCRKGTASLAMVLCLFLVSCSPVKQETADFEAADMETESRIDMQEEKVLVAYFSWAENAVKGDRVDAVSSSSVVSPGNVQQLAGWIQERTGGDLFSIHVSEPYPSDWDSCLERANKERNGQTRPEIDGQVKDMDSIETIFLGYPTWRYGAPMAVLSFLEEYDFSGKQVYLFCSHGTGGVADSVKEVTDSMPGATISDRIFDCYGENASNSRKAVLDWTEELGY